MPPSPTIARLARCCASPRFLLAAGILAVLAFAALHQVYLGRAHPDALYMDSLRLLFQLDQWEAGKLSTLEFWGQGSSHRGFVNQLFLLGNVNLFSLDVLLVNRLTGAVIGCVALILIIGWCRDSQPQVRSLGDALVATGVSVTIAGLCYSWAGFELLTLDLGLPLWFKNLCFVSYFCAHAYLLGGRCRHPRVCALLLVLAAPVVVLVMGMGWNYAFLGATLAMQVLAFLPAWRSPDRWLGVLPCVALLAAMAVYLGTGTVADAAVKGNVLNLGADAPLISLYALGSTIGNPEAVGRRFPFWFIAVAGACILMAGLVFSVRWLRRGAPGSRLPAYLILYGALVAVSVTLARGADGPGGVMASRYYMDLVLGLIGVIWITARELRAAGGHVAAAVMAWAMLGAVGLAHLDTYRFEWGTGPARALAFADMNVALLRAVPDENSAALLQSPLAHARHGVEVMRIRQLSVFAGHPELRCSGADVGYGDGWHRPEAQGRWSKTRAEVSLPASCACDFVATFYVPEVFHARQVEIARQDHRVAEAVLQPGRTTDVDLGSAGAAGPVTLSMHPAEGAAGSRPGTADEPELGALLTGFSVRCAVP